MRIAINTRFLLPDKMEGFGWYTFEIVKRLVEQHPEHEFIFFFDRAYDARFVFGPNVTPVVLRPPARHPVLFFIWFEYSVRKALKKYHVDLFFSPDGYLSLRSEVPQIGVIHDINFEHFPKDLPRSARKYLQRYFPKFAQKAEKIITVSEYSKQDISKTYKVPEGKIHAIWNGAATLFQPLDSDTQNAIRERYTGGAPYFLFVGSIHPRKNVDRLLSAFSAFKKVHPGTHKMVVAGTAMWSNNAVSIPDAIREDLIFTGHVSLSELSEIMGAAFALTFVPYFEGFGIPLVEAMRCGTPIVAGNQTSLPEVAEGAALFCDPFSIEDIASKLLEITQNDKLRNSLSQKGLERSKLFSWDKAAAEVAKVLGL